MPPTLDAPPAQPPDVASRLDVPAALNAGSSEPVDAKAAMASNPQGALMVQAEAVEKVVKQMSAQSPAFAPFGERIIVQLKTGIQEALKNPSQAPSAGAPQPGMEGDTGSPSSFPG